METAAAPAGTGKELFSKGALEARLQGDEPAFLKARRRQALEQFLRASWPVRTDEEWRRTDPDRLDPRALGLRRDAGEVPPWRLDWPRAASLPPGLIFGPLSAALREHAPCVEQALALLGSPQGLRKYAWLHELLWAEGLFCRVPRGMAVELPVQTNLTLTEGGRAVFPRALIVVEEGAQLTLIDERRCLPGTGPAWIDGMVQILLGDGARLRYVHLQHWAPGVRELYTQRAVLGKDAHLLNVTVGMGAALSKANIETRLERPGGRADLLGVYFGAGDQHFDVHTLQDHAAPNTATDLFYETALKDKAEAVYTGLIRVEPRARKTDAFQTNRNLLLNTGPKADSIPMLEILANDVRCSHAAAAGPVDENQLFYLMTRGLPRAQAQRLVIEGFFDQVFRRIPLEQVREDLLAEVRGRLREGA